jgi:hypothetical protein
MEGDWLNSIYMAISNSEKIFLYGRRRFLREENSLSAGEVDGALGSAGAID